MGMRDDCQLEDDVCLPACCLLLLPVSAPASAAVSSRKVDCECVVLRCLLQVGCD
jgi:hypothetical protein